MYNLIKKIAMRLINIFLSFLIISTVSAQDNYEIFALGKASTKDRGLVISEQFLKIHTEAGNTEIMAELGQLKSLSKGTTAFNHITNELLIWAKETPTEDYKMYVVDATSGNLSQQPVTFKQAPVDVHYDMRLQKFFGIRHSETKDLLEIIEIDKNMVTSVMDLPNLKSVSLGVTAFDSNNSFYIFAGTDNNYKERLYVIDIVNRQILSSSIIDGYYFYELQYDVNDSKLYGMCRKRSNTEQFFFVEIIPMEARPVIIAPMRNLKGVSLGGSTFEQKEGLYIYNGTDIDKSKSLYVIDIMTGDIITKTKLGAKITAMECNNAAFLNTYFNELAVKNPNVEPIQPIKEERKISYTQKQNNAAADFQIMITPKFILDEANIDIKIENGEGFEIDVFNATGTIVKTVKLFKSDNAEDNLIDLSSLYAGIYLLKIKTANRTYTQRVIKR